MSGLNPLAGVILQSIQTQREAGVEKEHQVRREQILSKNIAAEDDRFEHQVESSEQVDDVHGEEQPHDQRQSKQKHSDEQEDDDKPHVDMTA